MDKEYSKARIKLTLIYFGITLAIITFFSIVLVGDQFIELNRISQYHYHIYSDFGPPEVLTDPAITDVLNQVRFNTIARTVGIDIVLLAISVFISYYLSGKTLEPIHESYVKQKTFIANASHELKTPLTAMKTEAEVLLRSDRSKEELKAFVASTLDETNKLTQLTYALLDLARADTHSHQLHPENLALVEVVQEQEKQFALLAKNKKITICKRFTGNPKIYADKRRIEQLIGILLDNAIKYNKENGEVTLLIKKVKSGVLFEVKDSGIGIDEKNMHKVFDRFYRVSEDRNIPGYGLGLSIAKQIVDECNAAIELTSILGDGTTLRVVFPSLQ